MKLNDAAFLITYSSLILLGCKTEESSQVKETMQAAVSIHPEIDGQWTPLVSLKDITDTFIGTHEVPRPDSGWWVTPIHANLLPDGHVLMTGWSRPKAEYCADHQGRQNGTSFVLSPNDLNVTRPQTINIHPLNESPEKPGDVLYCSGHAPLSDGRVLMMGGARYTNLDFSSKDPPEGQDEFGLNYARVFSQKSQTFERVPHTNPGGPANSAAWPWYSPGMMWYPTMTRLPDGKILVNGGWAKWYPLLAPNKFDYLNKSVTTFDPKLFAAGKNPWATLVRHEIAPDEVSPDTFDYPRVHVLPKPVKVDGILRELAIFGGGKSNWITFLSVAPGIPESKRFARQPNSQRPNNARASDTTSLLTADGEIMIMGGGGNGKAEGQRVDLYSPNSDTWRSINTGVTRHRGGSQLLPDGTVLLLNGEAMWVPDNNAGDRRSAQILDPPSGKIQNLAPWPGDQRDRGYHNIALLLKDGRVLVGGGRTLDKNQDGVEQYRIGCERPELRIFSPPYLFKDDRPIIDPATEGKKLIIGGPSITVSFNGPGPRKGTGAVLMALGAYTHSFDQNQRMVKLDFNQIGTNSISVSPPSDSQKAPPGLYNLFLVSDKGVPSIAKTIELVATK